MCIIVKRKLTYALPHTRGNVGSVQGSSLLAASCLVIKRTLPGIPYHVLLTSCPLKTKKQCQLNPGAMATTASQVRVVDPLSFMQSLSPRVYLWRPDVSDNARPAPTSGNPTLIVIFGWMNAGAGPLAKYVRQYQALFPASALLLVTCTFAGMTVPWLGLREAR